MNHVSTDVLIKIFGNLLKEHVCTRKFEKHDHCTRDWWYKINRGCSCKIVKVLSLVCKKWNLVLHNNTKRISTLFPFSGYVTEFKLSFTGNLKSQLIDVDRKLLLMFMKDIRKRRYDIMLDGDTIFVNRLYGNFNDWCKRQNIESKISIHKFRRLAEHDIKISSMNFRLIDV